MRKLIRGRVRVTVTVRRIILRGGVRVTVRIRLELKSLVLGAFD